MDGIEATRIIRDRGGPPVLALTTFDDDETLWGAIDAGVAGFVLKEAPGEDIVRATRLVAGGGDSRARVAALLTLSAVFPPALAADARFAKAVTEAHLSLVERGAQGAVEAFVESLPRS